VVVATATTDTVSLWSVWDSTRQSSARSTSSYTQWQFHQYFSQTRRLSCSVTCYL